MNIQSVSFVSVKLQSARQLTPRSWPDILGLANAIFRLRPYYVEYTGSRPITEVKQRRAWLVLGWVTAWEYQVL